MVKNGILGAREIVLRVRCKLACMMLTRVQSHEPHMASQTMSKVTPEHTHSQKKALRIVVWPQNKKWNKLKGSDSTNCYGTCFEHGQPQLDPHHISFLSNSGSDTSPSSRKELKTNSSSVRYGPKSIQTKKELNS